MKVSIAEEDCRIYIKHLLDSPGFTLLQQQYEDEVQRMAAMMLNPKTSDCDTLFLKGVINRITKLNPHSVATALLKRYEAKLSKMQTNGVVVSATP